MRCPLGVERCKNNFASSETILAGEPMPVQPERKIVRRIADLKLALPKLTAVHALGIRFCHPR
jgi:hypothetical protein